MRLWHLCLLALILLVLFQLLACATPVHTRSAPAPLVLTSPVMVEQPPPLPAEPVSDTTGSGENAPLPPDTTMPMTTKYPRIVPNCDRPRAIPTP